MRLRECATCRRDYPPTIKHFARRRDRSDGLDPRCLECLREQVKLSVRTTKLLPAFIARVGEWPDQQILSEIQWLISKLEVLRNAERERGLSMGRRRV